MDQTITIVVPEPLHQELAAESARMGKSIEDLAREALIEKFGGLTTKPTTNVPLLEDPVIAILRARGLLVEPSPDAHVADERPPTAEELNQWGAEASEAMQRMGKTLSDIVER